MALKIAIQMDEIAQIDILGDTSFALALEAQHRGMSLFYTTPDRLTYQTPAQNSDQEGDIMATCHSLKLYDDPAHFFDLGAPKTQILSEMDVILMRQDPPFDMGYITATHVLERLPPATLIVNNPTEVRNAPEKLFVLHFPDLIPPTLISRDADQIKAFRTMHKDLIIKPLFGSGGAGIFRLKPDDPNLNALLELFFAKNNEPLIAQKFLPEIAQGDKRILLLNGTPLGAINRLPQKGETRSNLHVGGHAEPATLTARDIEICTRLAPELKKRGLIFVGIDVIGPYLTEINVTSPTGIREMSRFMDKNLAGQFWDEIERMHAS